MPVRSLRWDDAPRGERGEQPRGATGLELRDARETLGLVAAQAAGIGSCQTKAEPLLLRRPPREEPREGLAEGPRRSAGGDGGSERAKAARDGLDSAPNSEGNAASGRASGLGGSTHHESRAGLRGADSKSEADMMERRSDRDRPDSAGGDSSALRATGWERQRSGA